VELVTLSDLILWCCFVREKTLLHNLSFHPAVKKDTGKAWQTAEGEWGGWGTLG